MFNSRQELGRPEGPVTVTRACHWHSLYCVSHSTHQTSLCNKPGGINNETIFILQNIAITFFVRLILWRFPILSFFLFYVTAPHL